MNISSQKGTYPLIYSNYSNVHVLYTIQELHIWQHELQVNNVWL